MDNKGVYRFNLYMLVSSYFCISYWVYSSKLLDSIFISLMVLLLWYYFFSYRCFWMDCERISSYNDHCKVDWRCIKAEDNFSIDRVYVKSPYEDYWKELTYGVILNRGDNLKKFDDCTRYYDTFGKLGAEFRFKLMDLKVRRPYMDKLSIYRWYKFLSLLFILIIGYIYWVIVYPMI